MNGKPGRCNNECKKCMTLFLDIMEKSNDKERQYLETIAALESQLKLTQGGVHNGTMVACH